MKPKNNFDPFRSPEPYWREKIAAAQDIGHAPAKGATAEGGWLCLLQRYLPARYKVEPGFVISADGGISEQIDCIVYDGTFTPTFFAEHANSHIPAEAVYAVFEIKQHVDPSHIRYASDKARSVRALRRTSAPYTGDGKARDPKPHFPIVGGLLACKLKARKWDSSILRLTEIRGLECKNKWLDIVLTAESGGVDYLSAESSLKEYPQEGGLMFGILRLVRKMVEQGTAPAVDWDYWLSKYEEGLKKPG